MKNLNNFNNITKGFVDSTISNKILSLIAHGSGLFYNFEDKPYLDIDLELILDDQDDHDMEIIKNILVQFDFRIECQVRYINEITNSNSTIMRSSYKIFMYYAYANGITLIGKNIYQELLPELKNADVNKSLIISMQIAYKDIRKSFLAGAEPYIVNKNIMRTFHEISMLLGLIDYKKLGTATYMEHCSEAFVPIIIKHFTNKLSFEEKSNLIEFIIYYKRYEILPQVFSTVNKIVTLSEQELFTIKGK